VGEFTTQTRGEPSRRAPGRQDGPDEPDVAGDLDLTLARAAERLRDETGARLVAALVRDPAAGVRVAASAGPLSVAPDAALLEVVAQRPRAVDLARGAASGVELEAAAQGFAAAVALGRVADAAHVLLVLAGEGDPPGAVRPRTLAALDAAARRLERPVSAAAAAARLARVDADLQRLDRLAALGDLLAEIAHEVRNPLVSVKTFLQLLPDRVDDPDFRVRFLGVVTEEVRRIETLLDAVLAQARPAPAAGQAPAEGAAVASALRTVADLLAHRAMERGLVVEVEAPDTLRVPMAEESLRQVVLNLALNALDATPGERGADPGRVRLAAARAGDGVEVRVEDQGPGVPSADRERIFQPFFSTKPGRPGGLGLAISRGLVERAGGRLEVVDAAGGGACFRARFARPAGRPGR
jgi:signal transduction histidine kinase